MSFAYLPLFTGDYLRDTRHLSPMKHGIFLLALMHCWDSKGPMPLDEQESAGICNCRSADEVEALRYVLDRFFIRMDDGHYNKRMADEVAKAERLSKACSDAGLKSAEARREKAREGKRTLVEGRLKVGSTLVEGRLVSPSPSPSPSPSLNSSPSEKKERKRFARAELSLSEWLAALKASGEKPIPENDPVFAYATEAGIPHEYLRLAWLEFRTAYTTPGAKKYADWRAVFRKAIRGNWMKVWYLDGKDYSLTTVGAQAQRVHAEKHTERKAA